MIIKDKWGLGIGDWGLGYFVNGLYFFKKSRKFRYFNAYSMECH